MAKQKRVLANTAETNYGASYQIGFPIDDNENTDGKIAWGKLVGLNGAGTSVKKYGSSTGATIIEADASTNTPALGIMITTTDRDQYGGLSLTSEFYAYKQGERENREFNLVKGVTVVEYDDADKTKAYYNTVKTAKTGTATVVVGTSTTAVVGTGTAFTTEFVVGDFIALGNEVRQIKTITDNTHLAVSEGFVANKTGVAVYKDIDIGKPVWLTTNGDYTIIKPTTAGDFIQKVGYVESGKAVVLKLTDIGSVVA